jgi:hypothetical protein
MQSSPKRAKIKLFQSPDILLPGRTGRWINPCIRPVTMHASRQRACFLLLLSPWTNTYIRTLPAGRGAAQTTRVVESRERSYNCTARPEYPPAWARAKEETRRRPALPPCGVRVLSLTRRVRAVISVYEVSDPPARCIIAAEHVGARRLHLRAHESWGCAPVTWLLIPGRHRLSHGRASDRSDACARGSRSRLIVADGSFLGRCSARTRAGARGASYCQLFLFLFDRATVNFWVKT